MRTIAVLLKYEQRDKMIACHTCPEAADIQDQPTSLRVEVGGKVRLKRLMLADCSNLN